jgi:transposase-like protein
MRLGEKFWSAHLAAAKHEGSSLSSYAKRHGVSVKGLYYWQNKLKATDESVESRQASKFVALRVREAVDEPRACGCSLVLPSGMRLELSDLPSPEWLVALGRAAQGEH